MHGSLVKKVAMEPIRSMYLLLESTPTRELAPAVQESAGCDGGVCVLPSPHCEDRNKYLVLVSRFQSLFILCP
jgi:hypothetical protein